MRAAHPYESAIVLVLGAIAWICFLAILRPWSLLNTIGNNPTNEWLTYTFTFLIVGLPFVISGFRTLALLPGLAMPHIIEQGNISAEVYKRSEKEFEAIKATINKEALK